MKVGKAVEERADENGTIIIVIDVHHHPGRHLPITAGEGRDAITDQGLDQDPILPVSIYWLGYFMQV